MQNILSVIIKMHRDVLFEFHLKFWNTISIGIPVRSNIMYKVDRLLTGLTVQQQDQKSTRCDY